MADSRTVGFIHLRVYCLCYLSESFACIENVSLQWISNPVSAWVFTEQ